MLSAAAADFDAAAVAADQNSQKSARY